MFIKKVSFLGIKGAYKQVDLDFSKADSSPKLRENYEEFGLKRNKSEFSVLKQIGIIGANSSGKTTLLKGIWFGFLVLSNNNWGMFLKKNKTFNQNKIEWKSEIIVPTKKGARKYMIELKIENNEIVYEKVDYIDATETTISKLKNFYINDGKKVVMKDFNDKTLEIYNFDNSISFSQRMRLGMISEDVRNIIVNNNHFELFSKIVVTNYFDFTEKLMIDGKANFELPLNPKLKSKVLPLLQVFDENIKDYYLDNENNGYFLYRFNKNNEKIKVENLTNYLSKGTANALMIANPLMIQYATDIPQLYDEINSSFHSGLFRMVFELFRNKKMSQTFFTTHSRSIFDFMIRRDQILHVSKDKNSNLMIKRASDLELDPRIKSAERLVIELEDTPNSEKMLRVLKEFNE